MAPFHSRRRGSRGGLELREDAPRPSVAGVIADWSSERDDDTAAYNAAMNAFDLLYEGNGSTATSLRGAQKQVEELGRYEPKFQDALAALEQARISVEDVGATLRDYAGGIQASPEHLAQVEDRLALLDRLKRKYGATVDEVIEFGADVSRKLAEVENKDEILRQLREELGKAANEYLKAARTLSKTRADAARKLEKLVEAEINDLVAYLETLK